MTPYTTSRACFLCVVTVLGLLWPSAVLPEGSLAKAKKPVNPSIVINSNRLEVDNQRKIVTFSGDVDAKRDDFTMTCQKMVLYYIEEAAEAASEKQEMRIDRIVATGKVNITRAEGGSASAEEATYYQEEEKIVLTGNPVVKQGDDFVEGSTITLFLKEDRSIVEGSKGKRARAVLSQGSEKR
jgi:lipopolysaccharide export system protein LptA